MSNLLWEDEDELRALCRELWGRLCVSEVEKQVLVNKAMEYGFREGYSRAVVQLSFETKEGNVESHLLH